MDLSLPVHRGEAHICLFVVQASNPAELAGAVPGPGTLTGGQDLPLFIPHVPVLRKAPSLHDDVHIVLMA